MTIIRRRTWQRAAVRKALKDRNAFVSAQDLYSLMRGSDKEVGLATIYRTLSNFANEGEADSVYYEGENLYRACTRDLHHHHLICRNCGAAVELVEKRTEQNGLETWRKALNNIMPSVEVKSRRVGGANFQVPIEVRPDRKIALGMKWMISFARKRGEKTMFEKLAGEIIAASKGEGQAVKRKEDTHKMAEANKAFSHFRF